MIAFILAVILFFSIGNADVREQEYSMTLTNSADISVMINIQMATVEIVGHNQNELKIESLSSTRPRASERADGLRSLYAEGTDNTSLGLSVTFDGDNRVMISSAQRRPGNFKIYVPNNVNVQFSESTPGYGSVKISDHNGRLEVNTTTGNIDIQNAKGPLLLRSAAGSINVVLSDLSDAGESSIMSTSGSVDITVPENISANWRLQSAIGDIFTNLDIVTERNPRQQGGASWGRSFTIEGKTNNGGPLISVRSDVSNIYIRKKE